MLAGLLGGQAGMGSNCNMVQGRNWRIGEEISRGGWGPADVSALGFGWKGQL